MDFPAFCRIKASFARFIVLKGLFVTNEFAQAKGFFEQTSISYEAANKKKHKHLIRMDVVYPTMNEGLPRLKMVLEQAFGVDGTKRFCTLLQETGAIIAGGSVLQAYQDQAVNDAVIKVQDIDIYVPVKTAKSFFDVFVRDPVVAILKPESTRTEDKIREGSYKSALYCKSFLQKNGIRKVYNFIKGWFTQGSKTRVEFDVMIVRNRRTPLQVVNNFDLTFCQTWFDGINIYASHPEDIRQKSGTLQGEYVDLFLKGNKFLHKRIDKYGKRGYKVVLDKQTEGKDIVPHVRKIDYICKRRDDSELMKHWSSRVLLSWFLKIRDNIEQHSNNMPQISVTTTY